MRKFIIVTVGISVIAGCAQVTRYLSGTSYFYRQLHADSWTESGGDAAVIDSTIERIKTLNSTANHNVDLVTKEYKPGNWQYQWDEAAQKAISQKDYFAAATYYTIAAYPFMNDDNLSNRSYGLALSNYKLGVENGGNYIEELKINTPKGIAYSYLHLPEKAPNKRLPLLIVTNGSDQSLTTLYPVYRDYLKPRGWAMITLDLPGIGSNVHIGINTNETNLIHQNLLHHLKQEPRIDQQKIALMASSFGGNAATKTAFTNPDDIVAVVNICGAVNAPFLKLKFALTQVPQMTGDAFLQRFDASKEEIIKTSDKLALSTDYLGKTKTSVPILSIGHDSDGIAPLSDMRLTTASSIGGKHIVVDKGTDEGHCPSDEIALDIATKWLDTILQ